jgi:molybdopterin-binding protein
MKPPNDNDLLRLDNISKRHAGFALEAVSFTVGEGDYFILLGESGAGKSMVLETIAGLARPDSGAVLLDGTDITRLRIQRRKIGLVFQDHAVFPHMKVRENLAYALHGKGMTASEKITRVETIAGQLSISALLPRYPSTLSGGELQRVALARTLIQEPRVLLLDEPLASLDTRLKSELRALLRTIHRTGQTIIHVTHDYEEALSLGTRIAVIDQGRIVQEGTPETVFHNPKSAFVAHFAGIRNFFPAKLVNDAGTTMAALGNGIRMTLSTETTEPEGFVIIRGEDIVLSNMPVDTSMTNNFEGTVTEIVPSRSGMDVVVNAGISFHALVTPASVAKLGLREGCTTWVHFKATAVKYLPK